LTGGAVIVTTMRGQAQLAGCVRDGQAGAPPPEAVTPAAGQRSAVSSGRSMPRL
jgi:hypothetical protein